MIGGKRSHFGAFDVVNVLTYGPARGSSRARERIIFLSQVRTLTTNTPAEPFPSHIHLIYITE